MRNVGIYVHIPFCVAKCHYCNFYSISNNSLTASYIKSLLNEINLFIEKNKVNNKVDTIYIGGGTPSILNQKLLSNIIDLIYRSFEIHSDCEITLEANPGTICLEYLKDIRTIGINRISLGIQSLDDNDLILLGRMHNSVQAIESFRKIREAGFRNVSVDLMSAIPNQDIKTHERNLEKIIDLKPEHISNYVLSIEKNTKIYNIYKTTKDEDLQLPFMEKTLNKLSLAGYFNYEISSFSSMYRYESRHNMKYWIMDPYIGFGSSAHSFFENKRWSNIPDVLKYIKKLDKKILPKENIEEIDDKKSQIEKIFLRLRTKKGININLVAKDKADFIIKKGLAKIYDNNLILTDNGFFMYDEVVRQVL